MGNFCNKQRNPINYKSKIKSNKLKIKSNKLSYPYPLPYPLPYTFGDLSLQTIMSS